MRRIIAGLLLAAAAAQAADMLEFAGLRWRVPVAGDWKVETSGGVPVLSLLVPRPATQPRRPTQFALAGTPDYVKVTVELEVKKEPEAARKRRTSVILVYAWRDPDHFNYVHLSADSAKQTPHHNGVFHVDGADRVRISPLEGPGTLLTEEWHKVRLEWDGATGKARAWVNGETSPSLAAAEPEFRSGKVGIGSFFDMGQFRRVRIQGTPAP